MKVLTIGTFDVPHVGHAAFLRRCEDLAAGGQVIVGVNSDRFVADYKGAAPLYRESERVALIGLLGYLVRVNDGPGRDLIDRTRPDVLAIGSDWLARDYLTQIDVDVAWLEERGIALAYLPYSAGISSTAIKERLA